MRKVVLVLTLAAGMLGGCQTAKDFFEPVYTPKLTASTDERSMLANAKEMATSLIAEARTANIALKRTIGDRVEQEIWSPEKAQKELDKTREYGKLIDQAQKAYDLGDFADAQGQIQIVQKLISKLAAEAAKQAVKAEEEK